MEIVKKPRGKHCSLTFFFAKLLFILSFLLQTDGFFIDWSFVQSIVEEFLGTPLQPSLLSSEESFREAVKVREANRIDEDTNSDSSTFDWTDRRKCYEELGCLELTDEWYHPIFRPFNLLPYDRSQINIRYTLFTRQRVTDPVPVFLSRENLLDSGFQPGKPVKFVVHGIADSGYVNWVIKLSQQLTVVADVNVIAVDWSGGSIASYSQGTANTRIVGLEVAHFIKFLMREFNTSSGDVHIIGHSLGAQSAGYTGQKIPGLGRITGLDPAQPFFHGMPTSVRLDPSDAKFVDVIHSDGRPIIGFGMMEPCGHIDFFPNGGRDQPGCKISPTLFTDIHGVDDLQRDLVACNHHKAIYFFIESLLSKCEFIGHACKDYESFLKGQCYSCGDDGLMCAKLGIDADKYPIGNRSLVRFYLTTTKSSPYCVHHYRVNIETANPPQAAASVTGELKMEIEGERNSFTGINLSPLTDLTIEQGVNISFLLESGKSLGDINQVGIEWKHAIDNYDSDIINFLDELPDPWGNRNLFLRSIQVLDIDTAWQGSRSLRKPAEFCLKGNSNYVEIQSGIPGILAQQC